MHPASNGSDEVTEGELNCKFLVTQWCTCIGCSYTLFFSLIAQLVFWLSMTLILHQVLKQCKNYAQCVCIRGRYQSQ